MQYDDNIYDNIATLLEHAYMLCFRSEDVRSEVEMHPKIVVF